MPFARLSSLRRATLLTTPIAVLFFNAKREWLVYSGRGTIEIHGEQAVTPSQTDTMERVFGMVEKLRAREVQMIGAAISTRSWSDLESAFNQLRDKIDNALNEQHRRLP